MRNRDVPYSGHSPVRRPRPKAWLRALIGGYIWRRCPTCGRMFGGHEDPAIIPGVNNGYYIICHACGEERKEYQKRKEQQ